MDTFINLAILLSATFAMEFVAWFTHKFVMHGLLWNWHEDHHKPQHKHGFFEKNDRFFLLFATPGIACIMAGTFTEYHRLLYVGLGITLYGLIYFLIHDVYIHRRFNWFKQLDSKYSRAILRAHGAHHAKQEKEDGESFGLLVVHPKFFGKRKNSALQEAQNDQH
jgi:beta-carotene 3-hydroxylase